MLNYKALNFSLKEYSFTLNSEFDFFKSFMSLCKFSIVVIKSKSVCFILFVSVVMLYF